MSVYYNNFIKGEVSNDEYWIWLDLMPQSVRDKINNAKNIDELQMLWQAALYEHGDEIERKIKDV